MKYFLAIVALLALTACDDGGSSNKNKTAPPPSQVNPPGGNQPQTVPPPTQTQTGSGDQTGQGGTGGTGGTGGSGGVGATMPEVSFVYNEWLPMANGEVALELQLSQPSSQPVVVEVQLVNGTAHYREDYAGFMGCADEMKQTVVFAPQQIHADVPSIRIKRNGNCNVEFSAHLVRETVQQAQIGTDTTRIVIPCR